MPGAPLKATTGRSACPHLGVLSAALLALACGGSGGGAEGETATGTGPPPQEMHAGAAVVDGFSVERVPLDTMTLAWSGGGTATVRQVMAGAGDRVDRGDTLALLSTDLSEMDIERLEMALELASARPPGMRTEEDVRDIDSLSALLDSMRGGTSVPFLAPLGGELVAPLPESGGRLAPGDTVTGLLPLTEARSYMVTPPEGCLMSAWPESLWNMGLVEPMDGAAVYSAVDAPVPGAGAGVRSVPREALYESGLSTFLVTAAGDTVSAPRLGRTGGGDVLVLLREDPGRLLRWDAPGGGGTAGTEDGSEDPHEGP